jgi:DNA-binding NarL/FixJ family response regulator
MKLRQFFSGSEPPPQFVALQPEVLVELEDIATEGNRTLDELVDDLLRFAIREHQFAKNSLDIWQQLTPRERQIAAHIWLGLTNSQIAERLSISENTVKTHIKSILAKFDTHSKENLRHMLATLDFSDWIEI